MYVKNVFLKTTASRIVQEQEPSRNRRESPLDFDRRLVVVNVKVFVKARVRRLLQRRNSRSTSVANRVNELYLTASSRISCVF